METIKKKQLPKYISKNEYGYYYFVRRIRQTNKIYKYSLKTKNCKIAKKIVNNFLKNTEYIFRSITLIDLHKINELLDNYQKLALIEDDILEQKRHKDLSSKGKDGGHPDTIEENLKIFQDLVFDTQQDKIIDKGRKLLKRTTPELQDYFKTLNKKSDIYKFMTKLIKKEGEIIRKDLNRTRMRFASDYQPSNIQNVPIEVEPKLLTTKTKVEILNHKKEQYKNKYRKSKDYKSKYESVLNIIENVNDKVYFEDYTEEDFDEIFYQIVETPNGITAKSFFNKYPLECRKIIDESKKAGKYVPQTCSTLEEKVGRARTFFNNCLTKKYIRTNYLNDLEEYGSDTIRQFSLEEKERTIITSYQLNKMFLECDIFKIRDIYHNQPSIFLVPLISLFTGTRLNELCSLKKEDIKDENGIFYFSIKDNDIRTIKTKKGNRKVPIHSFLINELKILDYVNSLPKNSLLFPDLEDKKHSSNGYGASVSKIFNRLKMQFLTEEDLELNKIDFHSLRTTFITRLHMGEVEEALINGLSGHKQNTMSYKRYITCELMRLQKEIEKLYIEDIIDNLKVVSKRILDLKFY